MAEKSETARAIEAAPHRLVMRAQNRQALADELKHQIKKLTAQAVANVKEKDHA